MFRPTLTALDLRPSEEEREALATGGLVRIPLETGLNVGPVNVTLVLGDKPAIIDGALHHADNLEQLERSLHTYDLSLSDIQEVWLTHPHIDHFGLTGAIIKQSGATTYALNDGVYRFNDYLTYWYSDRQAFHNHVKEHGGQPDTLEGILSSQSTFNVVSTPFTVDHSFQAGETLRIAGTYDVIPLHTPGHTPWCTSYWFPETDMLIVGDALRQKMRFNMILYTAEDVSPEFQGLSCFQDSLRKLQDIPAQWVVPGHGKAFTNHAKTINFALKRQQKRCNLMLNALEDLGPTTAFDMALHMYNRSITESALLLVMSDTIALLEWLHEQGQVTRDLEEGIVRFQLA